MPPAIPGHAQVGRTSRPRWDALHVPGGTHFRKCIPPQNPGHDARRWDALHVQAPGGTHFRKCIPPQNPGHDAPRWDALHVTRWDALQKVHPTSIKCLQILQRRLLLPLPKVSLDFLAVRLPRRVIQADEVAIYQCAGAFLSPLQVVGIWPLVKRFH